MDPPPLTILRLLEKAFLRYFRFLPALVAEPHHAAHPAGGAHHLGRLHGLAAALGIGVHQGLLAGRFCCFA